MSVDSRSRFGLVGAGAIAQAYAQALSAHPAAALVAVVDVRADAAAALGAKAGCPAFSSLKAMCAAAELDAAVVCTPPATHPEICIELLERGLHVLCEKPLAIDSRSTRRMLDAAARSRVMLTMASKYRYVEDVLRARAIIASGVLGDPVMFENTFAGHADMRGRWNSNPAISGGGVLIDNGTHSVDVARFLFGPLADVQAVEGKRVQGLKVEETVRLLVRTESGVLGSIDLSWSINKVQPSYLSIYGTQGTLVLGWKDAKFRCSSDADWTVFGTGYDKLYAFRSQISHFARAIAGESANLVSPDDALASVEVIEAAYAALRWGWKQPVARPLPDLPLPGRRLNWVGEPVA